MRDWIQNWPCCHTINVVHLSELHLSTDLWHSWWFNCSMGTWKYFVGLVMVGKCFYVWQLMFTSGKIQKSLNTDVIISLFLFYLKASVHIYFYKEKMWYIVIKYHVLEWDRVHCCRAADTGQHSERITFRNILTHNVGDPLILPTPVFSFQVTFVSSKQIYL